MLARAMADLDSAVLPQHPPSIEVYIFVGDEDGDAWFKTNHRFAERPAIDTVKALLDEARTHFAVLYPEIEATDFSVELAYLDDEKQPPSHRSSYKS
jgi:hypothetical protein